MDANRCLYCGGEIEIRRSERVRAVKCKNPSCRLGHMDALELSSSPEDSRVDWIALRKIVEGKS